MKASDPKSIAREKYRGLAHVRKAIGLDGNFAEIQQETRNMKMGTLVPRGNSQRQEPNTGLTTAAPVAPAAKEDQGARPVSKVTDGLVTQLATSMAKLTRAIAKDGLKRGRAQDSAFHKRGVSDGNRKIANDARVKQRAAMDAAKQSDNAWLANREAFAKATGAQLQSYLRYYADPALGGLLRPYRDNE